MNKLYVGCGLTGSPSEFRESVNGFKDTLRNYKYEVFDFVGLRNGTSADVYNWDIKHCVQNCEALIGVCDYPSIGLGWELSVATRLKKPVLALAHVDTRLTRLVLGAADVESNVEVMQYKGGLVEAVPMVLDWLQNAIKDNKSLR